MDPEAAKKLRKKDEKAKKNKEKTASNLTSRGGMVCQRTGRDRDADRRLYYGRTKRNGLSGGSSGGDFFGQEVERDSRFGV